MRRWIAWALLQALCAALPALAEDAAPLLSYAAQPSAIRPGKASTFMVEAASESTATLTLAGSDASYTLLTGVTLYEGVNALRWSGLLPFGDVPSPGDYTLTVATSDGESVSADVSVGETYPYLQHAESSVDVLGDGGSATVSFYASESGTVDVEVLRQPDMLFLGKFTAEVTAGTDSIDWDGTLEGEKVDYGAYILRLTLRTAGGELSAYERLSIDVQPRATELLTFDSLTGSMYGALHTGISEPYSRTADDGSFWTVPPGETDDAVLWAMLTQPIVVYDDGEITPVQHAYLRANPDGTGDATAQIHGLSQGLHVIGEANEYGYVLVEAFGNYDPDYHPQTPEERFYAFDICQGYIPTRILRTVEVSQELAILIDKLTQRLYIFRDGVRVTELTISPASSLMRSTIMRRFRASSSRSAI